MCYLARASFEAVQFSLKLIPESTGPDILYITKLCILLGVSRLLRMLRLRGLSHPRERDQQTILHSSLRHLEARCSSVMDKARI